MIAAAFLATGDPIAAILLLYPDKPLDDIKQMAPSAVTRPAVRETLHWLRVHQVPAAAAQAEDDDAAMVRHCRQLAGDDSLTARERLEAVKSFAALRKAVGAGISAPAGASPDLDAFLASTRKSG